MKSLFQRDGLLSSYAAVVSAVPSRSPKLILLNVKLEVADDTCFVSATDLEVGIRARVLGAQIETPGAALLSSRFGDILRTSSDPDLSVETTDGQLIAKGLRSTFCLASEDPDLFPAVPSWDVASWHTLRQGDLKRLIRQTIFATDEESTRYALGGVLVETTSDGLRLVATDGRRLASAEAPAQEAGEPKITGSPVLPAKALKLIARSLSDSDDPVDIAILPTSALIRTDAVTIYSRLVEGRFPRYQDVFPEGSPHIARITAGAFLCAVEQASIMTSKESKGIDLLFRPADAMLGEPARVAISATSADVGASDVSVDLVYEGPEISISLTAHYLGQFLKVLDSDAEIAAEIRVPVPSRDPLAPVIHFPFVFRVGDTYTHVIMPLTRDR